MEGLCGGRSLASAVASTTTAAYQAVLWRSDDGHLWCSRAAAELWAIWSVVHASDLTSLNTRFRSRCCCSRKPTLRKTSRCSLYLCSGACPIGAQRHRCRGAQQGSTAGGVWFHCAVARRAELLLELQLESRLRATSITRIEDGIVLGSCWDRFGIVLGSML